VNPAPPPIPPRIPEPSPAWTKSSQMAIDTIPKADRATFIDSRRGCAIDRAGILA